MEASALGGRSTASRADLLKILPWEGSETPMTGRRHLYFANLFSHNTRPPVTPTVSGAGSSLLSPTRLAELCSSQPPPSGTRKSSKKFPKFLTFLTLARGHPCSLPQVASVQRDSPPSTQVYPPSLRPRRIGPRRIRACAEAALLTTSARVTRYPPLLPPKSLRHAGSSNDLHHAEW